MAKAKVLLSWSSGKDSAWTLHVLRAQDEYDVVGLLTTVNESFARVAMHAVREALLEEQAAAAGLPLWKVAIPESCSNERYEAAMAGACARAEAEGIAAIAFGDLFLADIRAYRERQLATTGLSPLFPLWHRPTGDLAREMIGSGLRAVLTCIDPRKLPPAFAGRQFDAELLRDLPAQIDPCGEYGEFHSFAYAGPMFRHPLAIAVGETVERDGFVFADIRSAEVALDRGTRIDALE